MMLEAAPPRYPAPEWFARRQRGINDVQHCSFPQGRKLMTLCDHEGFDSLDDLLQAAATDSVCPAIWAANYFSIAPLTSVPGTTATTTYADDNNGQPAPNR
jgi:hypothetical protein